MKYMLDTNVCIDYMRGTDQGIKNRLLACKEDELCISSITLSELLYGVNRSSNPVKNRNALYKLLVKIEVIDYGTEAGEYYGIIRNELVRRGMVIGALDMLIAAHAMSNKLVLITHNTAEFGRISGLEIEDWHA
ncbi:MAG: type II toxin-antitoxin system VapC family toxin [Clostridiales bacterium]|nr:type II toxin-antitoxin system VapC family toxin [Clostridiales bacterium]